MIAAMRSRAIRAQSGMTLIEMLVAIVVGGAILASTATLVSKVVAANSAASEHLHSMQAIGELGRQFRHDVHRATNITIAEDESPRLTLNLDDGSRVEYLGEILKEDWEASLERSASIAEQVVTGP